jgi:hypothetical protein
MALGGNLGDQGSSTYSSTWGERAALVLLRKEARGRSMTGKISTNLRTPTVLSTWPLEYLCRWREVVSDATV